MWHIFQITYITLYITHTHIYIYPRDSDFSDGVGWGGVGWGHNLQVHLRKCVMLRTLAIIFHLHWHFPTNFTICSFKHEYVKTKKRIKPRKYQPFKTLQTHNNNKGIWVEDKLLTIKMRLGSQCCKILQIPMQQGPLSFWLAFPNEFWTFSKQKRIC